MGLESRRVSSPPSMLVPVMVWVRAAVIVCGCRVVTHKKKLPGARDTTCLEPQLLHFCCPRPATATAVKLL